MPKLNRTGSLPRSQNSDLKMPSDDESKIKISESVLEALPVTSPYYNISASKARLLLSSVMENSPSPSLNTTAESSQIALETNFPAKTTPISESLTSAKTLSEAAETYKLQSTKKLQLISRIRTRIDELTAFREEITQDIEENNESGEDVRLSIANNGTERDLQKFTLVVRDLEPTIGLFFGLKGRLDRANMCLRDAKNESDILKLTNKREQLLAQIFEAEKIRQRVENRRNQLAERLQEVLVVDDFENFKSYLKHKVTLFEQQMKIDDKIKLSEEQLKELRDAELDEKG